MVDQSADVAKQVENVVEGTGKLVSPNLMAELAQSGQKYTPDAVQMITKNADGKLMWLETGSSSAGLEHIMKHADDLAAKGVDVDNISAFIKNDLLTQNPIKTGSNAKGLYADYIYNDQTFRLAYGTNGYIVSLYPVKQGGYMYKVIKISEGDLDRFITVENETRNQLEVFDYSASTVPTLEDAFILEEGKQYNLKLELYGDVLAEGQEHKYGRIVKISIVDTEKIGKYEFYIVETDIGTMYIPKNLKSDVVYNGSKRGIFNFTRIDIIQVDDMIHPEY